MTSRAATASAKAGPLSSATPSRTVPKVHGMLSASNHSGLATPRTPELGPKSRSKISPVSSNRMADSPSGAVGNRNGVKFVMSTSTGSGPALT
jgi:hypothetical protein